MESMFGWAAINAILIAYGFGQKKWKFLMIPIAVKLCFWIASIYHAQSSYEEHGADWTLVVVEMDVMVNVIAGLIGVGIGFFLRRNKTKSEK
ncbi:hypothetical protein [Haemophilus parainfluenzae]|uniref:hypothetical protein n=1 Tax=Haemophilus parainfluenzae TaxID=729 RepID=UPI0018A611EA|nr:hypothetical protein [Haemophilus parainfluenzae]QOR07595.1 hypothetical protein INP99_07225 [Haemophilus parainfluenzae]